MDWLGTDWIGPVVTAVVVSFVMGALRQSAKVPAKVRDGLRWVEYSKGLKIGSAVGLLLPIGLVVLAFRVEEQAQSAVLGMVLLFGALIVPLAIETLFVKVGYDDQQMRCFSPWRKNRTVQIAEMGEPRFSKGMQWWLVPTERQGLIRLSSLISGGEELLRHMCELRGFAPPQEPDAEDEV